MKTFLRREPRRSKRRSVRMVAMRMKHTVVGLSDVELRMTKLRLLQKNAVGCYEALRACANIYAVHKEI
jgi:hypothetical protein